MGQGIRRSDDGEDQKIPMLDARVTAQDQRLVTPCFFNQGDGIHCFQGHLYRNRKFDGGIDLDGVIAEPVKLEGLPLQCPACEGKGVILTDHGREMIQFLQTYAYPMLREMVQDILDDERKNGSELR